LSFRVDLWLQDFNNDVNKGTVLRKDWLQKKAEIFTGKLTKPDAEDPDTVNHLNWYQSTGFTRPYPGEKAVRPASDFNKPAPTKVTWTTKNVRIATALSPIDRGEGFCLLPRRGFPPTLNPSASVNVVAPDEEHFACRFPLISRNS
jgi:hypothetical protein